MRAMATLAVVHPDLSMRGGAENVCMHVLEALQRDHELTLYTLSPPDVEALNDFFHTDVDPPTTRTVGTVTPTLRQQFGHRLYRLQAALLGRHCKRALDGVDAVVSTKNEFAFDHPSIQYIHSPQFAVADPGIDDKRSVAELYRQACASIAGVDREAVRSAHLLTNSEWTASTIETAYGTTARPVYPPVDVESFPSRDWSERESGFLTVGRIGPSKNVLQNVRVVDRLRERGHDVHLHVVGPTTDGDYQQRVERAAEQRDHVTLDGAVSRDELVDLITRHRYGLHGRPYEHFGMAVAEFVAGGAIPFAPASGGQVEILDGDSRLLYSSTDEAVELADHVLSDPSLQASLREQLDQSAAAYGCDRFEERIRSVVEEVVS